MSVPASGRFAFAGWWLGMCLVAGRMAGVPGVLQHLVPMPAAPGRTSCFSLLAHMAEVGGKLHTLSQELQAFKRFSVTCL